VILLTKWQLTGNGRFAYSAPPVGSGLIVRGSAPTEVVELIYALASDASGPM
jgi:hypothetical protein